MTRFSKRSSTLRSGERIVAIFVAAACLVLLASCSSSGLKEALPDQTLVYKKQREASENLEIPPDLTSGNFDDALDIPGSNGTATFSEYSGGRQQRQQVAAKGEVLPAVSNVSVKRSGNERWLEVQATPQQVWPQILGFWRQQGILLTEQNPAVGVMRTDWLDNRAEIRKDFLTRMMSKVVEGAYSTSTRDQYTVRVEAGPRSGTADVHMTHRGMSERMVQTAIGDGSRTMWEPSGTDHEKEAEMLRRLMVYMGAPKQTAAASLPSGASQTSAQPLGRLVTEGGATKLLIPAEFREAWRLTGTALDRAGFAVKDRDESQGLYYVRYAGKDASGALMDEDKPGFFSRMAFWRSKGEKDGVQQYRVKVTGTETESRVTVLDANGKPDQTESGKRILALMRDQMR